jgi:hypothetical protein
MNPGAAGQVSEVVAKRTGRLDLRDSGARSATAGKINMAGAGLMTLRETCDPRSHR